MVIVSRGQMGMAKQRIAVVDIQVILLLRSGRMQTAMVPNQMERMAMEQNQMVLIRTARIVME